MEERITQPNTEQIPASFERGRLYLLRDLWDFLKIRKKWWLLPIVIMMVLVGLLMVFGQSTAVSPFVYALF